MAKVRNHNTYVDFRGSFTPIELDCKPKLVTNWDQVNISINDKKGTFRGLHYQDVPQQKYIKVVQGRIIDYIYHLKTKVLQSFYLENQNSIFVSKDYAHGFLTLDDNTIVCYLTEGEYLPNKEHSIPYNTIPELKENILQYFSNEELILTDKDKKGK